MSSQNVSQLLNTGYNYMRSPAAQHALRNGSIEPLHETSFSRIFNRKMKMRDTFTSVFGTYNHSEPTVFTKNRPEKEEVLQYPKRNDDGHITYLINREYTLKKDRVKEFSESMYRMSDFINLRSRKPTAGAVAPAK